jgi:hypothetical protein
MSALIFVQSQGFSVDAVRSIDSQRRNFPRRSESPVAGAMELLKKDAELVKKDTELVLAKKDAEMAEISRSLDNAREKLQSLLPRSLVGKLSFTSYLI